MPREGAVSPPPEAAARSPHREDGGAAGGPRHQEDVGRQGYGAGPLRPLGRVRGRDDWYTMDQIAHLDRQDITAEINRMKLLSYWEDRSSKAEQDVGKMAPKLRWIKEFLGPISWLLLSLP